MREPAKSFEELVVWQKAHRFVLDAYPIINKLPAEERFGLASQFRRAAVSVRVNIAEGFIKRGKPDKIKFLNTAQGSLEECKYFLILIRDLGYMDTLDLRTQLDEVGRLLNAYISSIRRNSSS
jgi:four helix bundle protein